ncbi:globin, partial [bacterium LRH843]|nr:globin [bacterium LRH843]
GRISLQNNLPAQTVAQRLFSADCPPKDCCPPPEPSPKDLANVKEAWCEIDRNKGCYAKSIFTEVFKKYPDYAQLFAKFGRCPTDILKNEKF